MRTRNMKFAQQLIAIACATGTVITLTACGNATSESSASSAQQSTTQTNLPSAKGHVDIIVPSDEFTLSPQAPINSWSALHTAVVDQLKQYGFSSDAISTYKVSSISEQIDRVRALTEQIITTKRDKKAQAQGTTTEPTTLIIAPFATDESIRQMYGDYVTSEDDSEATEYRDLADAIDRAQAQGIHVVELGTTTQVSTPDAVVKLVDAESIGSTQAQELVTKLDLAHAQKAKPKSIEVFIPSAGDDAFAQSMFHGVWSVLAPYYQSGVLVSPSARLTASSTEASWSSVTIDAVSNADITSQVRSRFGFNLSPSGTPLLDGVLCGSDQVADQVISALSKAGYTGTSATVNPDISMGGIVKQLAGESDLKRNAVPVPAGSDNASTSSQSNSSTTTDGTESEQNKQDNTKIWPIITGYGSTISNLQYLIDGSQWSTSLVNRNTVALSVTGLALAYNTKTQTKSVVQQLQKKAVQEATQSNAKVDTSQIAKLNWDSVTSSNEKITLITIPLLDVSATNIKSVLIDGGYIRPQDIGL